MDVTNIKSQPITFIPNWVIREQSAPDGKKNADGNLISDLSRNLNSTNFDLQNSSFSYDAGNLNFSMKFLNQNVKQASLNGYYSEDLSSGEMSFKYNYSKITEENGKEMVHNYEVNFNLSFKNLSSIAVERSEVKEDILDFLRRITKEIFTKLSDNKTNITALVLDPDDLKDIAQLSDKKVVQLIYRLIEMIKWAFEAKKLSLKGKEGTDIIYSPKRGKIQVTQTEKKESTSFNYSYSLRETSVTENSK